MVRNDLLVAPALLPESQRNSRMLYLPYPDSWFAMNLRPDDPIGVALQPAVDGGSRIDYICLIDDRDSQLPYITPMYIREGMKQALLCEGLAADARHRGYHSQDRG